MQPTISPTDSCEDFHTRHRVHRPIPILAVDGGGIRGILPCKVLDKITDLTHRTATDLFRLQAGTSTGAIITMGLNVPSESDPAKPKYNVDQILQMYRNDGRTIFHKYYGQRIWSVCNPKYDGTGLTRVLDQYFGQTQMKDSIGEVLVTSYDAFRGKSCRFTKNDNMSEPNLKMATALLRSTAAPTFFPSQQGPTGENYLDGGLAANNPTAIAYAEAMETLKDHPNFLFCSLGTGKAFSRVSYAESNNWGELQWAEGERILNVLFDSQAAEVDKIMKILYPRNSEQSNYFRFQIEVDPGHASLDDASRENIQYLEDLGDQLVEESQSELRELAAKLEKAACPEEYAVIEE